MNILEDIINNATFYKEGVKLPDGMDTITAYKFLHEAIADDYLPVWKAIGISVTTAYQTRIPSIAEHNPAMLESIVEVATNLADKVFITPNGTHSAVTGFEGALSADSNVLLSNGVPSRILYKNPKILTATKKVTVDIFLKEDTGYKSMEDSVENMNRESKYFPLNVKHSIHDFVRICPPREEGFVYYMKHKNLSAGDLKYYFSRLYILYTQNKLDRRCLEWVSKYAV